MSNELENAVRQLCLAFPEAEELLSRGTLSYRISGGKIFATYVVNHHGDGRIALWLRTPHDMQDAHVRAEPEHFFVPPYVGPSGWLGARLDAGLAWKRVAPLVRAAYEHVAPSRLRGQLQATPSVPAPKRRITVEDVDPWRTPRGRRVLASMRKICLDLPDTAEGLQFGQPVWRAGKKVFAQAYCYEAQYRVAFWVGVEAQWLFTKDSRYSIPPYIGHQGWIALDVSKGLSEAELRSLALSSYRHFALRRMLAKLPSSP
jgi:predicted DNA-binding protein (MmcQ/YjbR family)